MKALFKQLIAQFQEEALPLPIPRILDLPDLGENLKKAIVLIGVRRSGKTWMLYQYIQTLLAAGFSKEKMLYINFEDDRLAGMGVHDFQSILDAYYELYPQHMHEKIYLFFDEIQEVEGWEKFIRRLLDQEQVTIFITGSSAKMLSKEIASSLRGRTLSREVYPFSFIEFLRSRKMESKIAISSKKRAQQKVLCEHYLHYGGFPETLNCSQGLHRELIQSYIETVIYRDVVERYKISNIHAVKQFIFHCLRNPATLLSINKIYNDFKSQGIAVSKNSLYDYFNYFEDAYCLFSVPFFSLSHRSSLAMPKKIYPVDPGIIATYSIKPDYDKAAELETVVYLYLRKKYTHVYYYHTKTKKEVDFLVKDERENVSLYQVCLDLDSKKTLKREMEALIDAMEECGLTQGYIVTLENNQQYKFDNKLITCILVQDFLLQD